jgi:hypothetical protein
MARGTTLGEMVDMLRSEARLDPNPALSVNMLPMMQQTIRRTQERLYDDFDWPFLRVKRDITAEAGSRYYDAPADLNLERIVAVDYRWGERWIPVERGISLDPYNARDSDNDDREDPVQRWDIIDTGDGPQIEIWPIPIADQNALRLTGFRTLTPLTANSDRADLDDMAITLFAAAELLAAAKSDLASIKLQQAKARVDTLQGRITKTRTNSFTLGGCDPSMQSSDSRRTPQVAYVRTP